MTTEDTCWIILTGGQKGGTGKTTTATNLAALFARDGWRTLLVNSDSQPSLVLWNEQRADLGRQTVEGQGKQLNDITFVSLYGKQLHKDIKKLTPQFDVAIIDAGGYDSNEFRAGLLVADVLVSPIKASAFDTWTLDKVHEIVSNAKINNPDLVAGLLINQVNASSSASAKTQLKSLIEDPDEPMSEFIIFDKAVVNRNAYALAPGLGLAVHEMLRADPKAKEEMLALQQQILKIFQTKSEEAE